MSTNYVLSYLTMLWLALRGSQLYFTDKTHALTAGLLNNKIATFKGLATFFADQENPLII